MLGLVLLLVIFAALLRTPLTVVAAALHSETVKLTVRSADAARIGLHRARKLGSEAMCLEDVIVNPGSGARVSYTRPSLGTLLVSVDGKAAWSWKPAVPQTATPPAQPLYDESESGVVFELAADGDCKSAPHVRLPVQGDSVRFGAHASDLQRVGDHLQLLGGRLTVFARSIPPPEWLVRPGLFARNALYTAGEFPLPGGAVIEERVEGDGKRAAHHSAVWSGFADVDFRPDGAAAMMVEASTNAHAVSVYLMAPNISSLSTADPETISLTLMARLTGDPNLLLVYGMTGVVALLLGLFATLREVLFRSRRSGS